MREVLSFPIPSSPVFWSKNGAEIMTARNRPDAGGLTWRTRLIYGCGGVVERIGNQTIKDLGNPIYNLILGINPAVIGLVIMATRIFDAFFDPVIGHWSDRTKTRWGRRRPFMLAGALLAGVALVPVFWLPQALDGLVRIVWMLGFGVIFYALFTLFSVPYRALAYELAPGYHEKTQIIAMRTIFMTLASAVQPWIYPATQSGWFGTPRESIPWLIGGLGLLLTVAGLVPTLFLKEPPSPPAGPGTDSAPFLQSLRETLACHPFRILLVANTANMIGVNLSFGFGSYITIYHVFGGNQAAAAPWLGWSGMVFIGVGLVAAPTLTAVSRRFGKKRAQQGFLLFAACGAALSWWLFTPSNPWLQLLLPFFVCPAMMGLWMFGDSMVGDVCAVEARKSGQRREAIFSAVFGWILKAAAAFAILGSNLLLNATGFDVTLGENQPDGTVFRMRLIFVAFLLLGFLGSFFLLSRFHLEKPQAPGGSPDENR